jgi:hypothetical protein
MLVFLRSQTWQTNKLTLTGILLGDGVKARCGLRVHVKTGPFFVDSQFTHCTIEQGPCDFPDGTYEARFLNQAVSLRHENGHWTEGIPWETAT